MTYDNPDVLVSEPVEGHGSTVAAWFLVIVTTIGLIVATVAFDTFHLVGMCVGFGIMIVGLGGSETFTTNLVDTWNRIALEFQSWFN